MKAKEKRSDDISSESVELHSVMYKHHSHQKFILSVIEELCSKTTSRPWRLLRVVSEAFNLRQYEDLVEERADCMGLCGFAVCRNRVQRGKRKVMLDRKNPEKYARSRDERRYCSEACFRVSVQFCNTCVLDEASYTRSNFEIEQQRQKYRRFVKVIKQEYKRNSWYDFEEEERKEWDSIMDRLIWNTFQLPRYNHQEAIEFVRHRRRYVNFQRPCDGTTLLQGACFRGVASVVKILLELGADKNLKNKYGHTAIDIARDRKHEKVLCVLIPTTSSQVKNLNGENIQLNDVVKGMGDSFRIVERGFSDKKSSETTETSSSKENLEENVFEKFIRARPRVRVPRPSDLGPLNRISVALTNWFTKSTYAMLNSNKGSNITYETMSEEIRQRLSFVHAQCSRSVEHVFQFLSNKNETNVKAIQKRLEVVIDTFDVSRAPIDILPTYQWHILTLYLLSRFRVASVCRDGSDAKALFSRVSKNQDETDPFVSLDSALRL